MSGIRTLRRKLHADQFRRLQVKTRYQAAVLLHRVALMKWLAGGSKGDAPKAPEAPFPRLKRRGVPNRRIVTRPDGTIIHATRNRAALT